MKPLVVLRPEPGASATSAAARECGLEPLSLPLFRIEPVAWEAPEPSRFDGLLLTSANAVRCSGEGLQALRGLKAYAVGEATAEAAREAGFDIASTGDAGVERLLSSLEPDLELLHLCGENRKDAPDVRQRVTAIPVYRATAIDDVTGLDRIEGAVVLVHSPRAGSRLAELAREQGVDISRTVLAAISADAGAATGEGWQGVEIADEPRDAALLALAARLCNNPPQQ